MEPELFDKWTATGVLIGLTPEQQVECAAWLEYVCNRRQIDLQKKSLEAYDLFPGILRRVYEYIKNSENQVIASHYIVIDNYHYPFKTFWRNHEHGKYGSWVLAFESPPRATLNFNPYNIIFESIEFIELEADWCERVANGFIELIREMEPCYVGDLNLWMGRPPKTHACVIRAHKFENIGGKYATLMVIDGRVHHISTLKDDAQE